MSRWGLRIDSERRVMDISIIICVPLRSTISLFPRSTTRATLLPQNRKKLARTRRRGRRRGISLRALRTNYRAAHVVVELAIIEGTRSALRGGYIKSAFLMYFYLYIFFKYYIPSKTTII
jgi:hypothetical protein